MILAPMSRFYRVLPSTLLEMTVSEFRLAFQMWRLHVLEENRQMEQARSEADARART